MSLTLLSVLGGLFSSYWAILPNLDMRIVPGLIVTLLCCVWLIFLGGLLYSEGKQDKWISGKVVIAGK